MSEWFDVGLEHWNGAIAGAELEVCDIYVCMVVIEMRIYLWHLRVGRAGYSNFQRREKDEKDPRFSVMPENFYQYIALAANRYSNAQTMQLAVQLSCQLVELMYNLH